MARVRQARRCGARRTDGQPCKAYAIEGGTVCRAHGGSAPQVRRAAYLNRFETRARAQMYAAVARRDRDRTAWQIERILTTARLLDIPIEDVTPIDIMLCHAEHGRPALIDEMPGFRTDRRYRLPKPPQRRPPPDPRG